MGTADISLTDRFDLEKSPVLLNGTQALVRLMLMQKARDRQAGNNKRSQSQAKSIVAPVNTPKKIVGLK